MNDKRNGSSGNFSANFPLEQERAKPKLVEGCIVRSRSAFRGRTAKLLKFKDVCGYDFAIVQINIRGSLIEYPCLVDNLEVVE